MGVTDTVSVIIPVYKVEPYLRECLDSVLGQTHRALEIIVVDDGSPDGCGAICDEYAEKDARVRVIHQKNGGLSAARNTGIRAATGEYLAFVDSDDWIEPDMYACLTEGIRSSGADIAVCGHYECQGDARIGRGPERRAVCGTEEALRLLLAGAEVDNSAWNKLYRRALFDGIAFPEGRVYEDLAVMGRLFARAKRVSLLPERQYCYRIRPGSILGDTSLRSQMDRARAAKDCSDALSGDWPQLQGQLAGLRIASAVGIWASYLQNPRAERAKYRAEIERIAADCRAHIAEAPEREGLGLAGRIATRLTPYANAASFAAAGLIGRLYRLKHGRNL